MFNSSSVLLINKKGIKLFHYSTKQFSYHPSWENTNTDRLQNNFYHLLLLLKVTNGFFLLSLKVV